MDYDDLSRFIRIADRMVGKRDPVIASDTLSVTWQGAMDNFQMRLTFSPQNGYELTAWASPPVHGDSSVIHQWIDPPAEPVRIFRFIREGMWTEDEDFAPVELFNKLPDSIIGVVEVANVVFGGLIGSRLSQIYQRELERLQGLDRVCQRLNDPEQRNNVRSIAS